MTTETLLQQIRKSKVYIFGTGFVAEMFRYALEKKKLADRVRGFIKTETRRDERFHGLPVWSMKDWRDLFFNDKADSQYTVEPDVLVCLAVHEAAAEEVMASLKVAVNGHAIRSSPNLHEAAEEVRSSLKNIVNDHAVWIYPNLHELLFGSFIARGKMFSLTELLEKQDSKDHCLDIRYLAAEAYLKASVKECLAGEKRELHERRGLDLTEAFSIPAAEDLYIRAMAVHSSRETAEKRLELFKKLVRSMAEKGFCGEKPVLIDTDGRIIDGFHRTSAAAALGIEEIPCNVVRASDAYDVLLTDKVRLPDDVLKNAGFTNEELEMISKAGKRMRSGGSPNES